MTGTEPIIYVWMNTLLGDTWGFKHARYGSKWTRSFKPWAAFEAHLVYSSLRINRGRRKPVPKAIDSVNPHAYTDIPARPGHLLSAIHPAFSHFIRFQNITSVAFHLSGHVSFEWKRITSPAFLKDRSPWRACHKWRHPSPLLRKVNSPLVEAFLEIFHEMEGSGYGQKGGMGCFVEVCIRRFQDETCEVGTLNVLILGSIYKLFNRS